MRAGSCLELNAPLFSRIIRAAFMQCPHRRARYELMHASGFLIAALYQTGRWSELDAVLVEHVAAFAQESDSTCEMLQGGVLAGATCLAQRGDLKRSRELEAMAPPFVVTDPLWAGYADGWRARLQVAAGDPRKGLRQAEAMFGSVPVWRRFHLALVLIDALIALRDLDALSRFVPAARELSGGMVVLLPTCDRAQGWVAAASGDGMAALRSLDRAVEGFDRLNVPFEAARTRELLASVSSPKAARGLLEHALHSYEKLGAAPHAERARTALSN